LAEDGRVGRGREKMEYKYFQNRIIHDQSVYLTVQDCAKILETSPEQLEQMCGDDLEYIPDIGFCVKEPVF